MKKFGKLTLIVFALAVAFSIGAFVVGAQGSVDYGDVFACFSEGNGYLVDDPDNCQAGEAVVGWYSAEHFVGLDDMLEELTLADEAFVEELELVNERLEDEVEDRTEADEALQEQIDELEERVETLENLLQHFSRSGDDLFIAGANLHVVNGTGTTDGAPNSLGNVIIGYNELKGFSDDRSGSHMLVIGSRNNFSSFGGIVAGEWNETSGEWATITGGSRNIASGKFSSISGGGSNTASGEYSSVSGGGNNIASFYATSVSGGNTNEAVGASSSVSGGTFNTASGGYSSVTGGHRNIASGVSAAVCGGDTNTAASWYSSIGGGQDLTTSSMYQFLP